MKKTWIYNGRNYEMVRTSGYGQYTLNGHHCTNSSIWDWCDEESNEEKYQEAMESAELFVKSFESM